MLVSEKWLREWVSPPLDTQALAERFTMAGLEVGGVEPAGPALENFVVGNVITMASHPEADKLRVCQVDVGDERSRQIVCGAANVCVGAKVVAALPGALLPGGAEIGATKIRGVASAGMLCSAQELGLGEDSDGLLLLPAEAPVGTPLGAYLDLDDAVLDIDLTPNRGDCLSIGGMARELSALTAVRVQPPTIPAIAAAHEGTLKVRISARKDCPHYVGRLIKGINPRTATPIWMQERLRRLGQRSINAVVDITNYVMLELGQPMHGFDAARVSGGITVRHAHKKERLTLLDGSEVTLPDATLVIADDTNALAVAGIMGGMDSAVSDETRDVFLESAFFQPNIVAGRARALGLQTESSHRFERGVDPALQRLAIERATALLLDICGGTPGPVVAAGSAMDRHRRITLRAAETERLLGINIPRREVASILRRLGLAPVSTASGWKVTVPSHRFDIERECDLIEEIARVYGYERIVPRLPVTHMTPVPIPEGQVSDQRARLALVDRDYQEVMTYSFVDPSLQERLDPDATTVAITNPISADMAVMRSSLWPGLLQTVVHNRNRQQRRIRIFEVGHVFRSERGAYRQESVVGGAVLGPVLPEQWASAERAGDFYDLKNDVMAVLGLPGRGESCRFEAANFPALHPGQAAKIIYGDVAVGKMGALDPRHGQALGLEEPVLLFELRLDPLQTGGVPAFQPISRFPAIRRDLAVIVADDIAAAALLNAAAAAAGEALAKLDLFDVYRGKGIDSKRKSIAFALTLQHSSRTLRDKEVDEVMARVIETLRRDFGAELRK